MKSKLLNACLIISSLFGFLQWGGNNEMFLFQLEAEIFSKIFYDPLSIIHPLIILPILGQALLLITLFQKKPTKILTYLGITGIGILLLLMFLIGFLALDFKILVSTTPFLAISFYTVKYNMKSAKGVGESKL